MTPRLALGIGNHANLQVASLDTYTGLPALDYHSTQTGQWMGGELPDSAGQAFATLAAANGNDHNLQVVMLGAADGQPYLYWQASGNGIWTGPVALPPHRSGFSRVALAPGSNGFLQAILLGRDDGLLYAYAQNPSGGTWTGPMPLGESNIGAGYKDFALGVGWGGTLYAIALTATSSLPVLFSQSSSGAWSGPLGLTTNPNRPYDTLATGSGNDGNLQVILLGLEDGQPDLVCQNAGTGAWSVPAPLLGQPFPGGFSTLGLGNGNEQNLQLILVGKNGGQPYLCWQAAGNGIWSGPTPLLPNTPLPRTAEVALMAAYSLPDLSLNLQVVLRAAGENSLRLAWQDGTGNWHYYGRLASPTWMQDIGANLANKQLRCVQLPGTHDSATFGITGSSAKSPDAPGIVSFINSAGLPGAAAGLAALPAIGPAAAAIVFAVIKAKGNDIIAGWATAQTLTIGQQLRAGIRYFDIRVGKTDSGALWIMHAFFSVPLADVLNDVTRFLAKHPKEIVILDFNAFGDFVETDYAALKATLAQQFGSRLASRAVLGPASTVQAFLAAGANVVVTWRPGTTPDGKSCDTSAPSPFIWDKDLRSDWPAVVTLPDLQAKLDEAVGKAPLDRLWVLQGIFTPDNNSVLNGIFQSPGNLREMAAGVSPTVVSWLPQAGWGTKLNIVILDHVEDCPVFIETMVNINLSETAPPQPPPVSPPVEGPPLSIGLIPG